jgi:hypothetical protein
MGKDITITMNKIQNKDISNFFINPMRKIHGVVQDRSQ